MAKSPEAKPAATSAKARREPGRVAQVIQVFKMTVKADRASLWLILAAFLGPTALGLILGFIAGGWFYPILMGILGASIGFFVALTVLGQRAERVAYGQIAGKPGAVGAVIGSALSRNWIAQQTPVNISPRTQDAVYLVVGRTGVTLIGEGPKSRTKRMLDEERRRVNRIVPNVAIHYLYVGPDDDATPLHRLRQALRKNKRSLRRTEVTAVANRLQSMKPNMPSPKGVDPLSVRPDHKAMRGR